MGLLDLLGAAAKQAGAEDCTIQGHCDGTIVTLIRNSLCQQYVVPEHEPYESYEGQLIWWEQWLSEIAAQFRMVVSQGYR